MDVQDLFLISLSVRKLICPRCGFEHDRDINAGENIMFEGLRTYMKECVM